MKKKNTLKKKKSKAFGKEVYLLGEDKQGIRYWLESPSWDCEWYWGFGYVETYTSHQHINNLLGDQIIYDDKCQKYVKVGYIHNLYDTPLFVKTTFSYDEGWLLTELFKQFYLLRDLSDFCHKSPPGCHITTSPVNHGDLSDWYNKVNKEMIPKITKKVLEILSDGKG